MGSVAARIAVRVGRKVRVVASEDAAPSGAAVGYSTASIVTFTSSGRAV
jgi:hypothetical protein